jgi:hypothetical protein
MREGFTKKGHVLVERCGVVACALAVGALPLSAQDVVQNFLSKVDTQAVTWANVLVVLGIVLLGGKYMFIDHRDPEKLWGTIWGCLFLLGARAIATFFLPVAAP